MPKESENGITPINVAAKDIFLSQEFNGLTPFGSYLQGLILDKKALLDEKMTLQRKKELEEEIGRRYVDLERMQGIKIPRDDETFANLELQFSGIIMERGGLSTNSSTGLTKR